MGIWYWLNANLGIRKYFKEDGGVYIKEGFNKPEELFEHLRQHHPEEYKLVEEGKIDEDMPVD